MAYIIKGQNAEEIFELSQINKTTDYKKSATIDFLDVNLDHQLHNGIFTFTFDVATKKEIKIFTEASFDIEYINIAYVFEGPIKLATLNQKENVVLQKDMWAILTSSMSDFLNTNCEYNTHVKVRHTLILKQIIDKFIDMDFEFSTLLKNTIANKTDKNIIMYGYADINIKKLFFEAHSLFSKNDPVSKYLYTNKVEELFLSVLNSHKKENDLATKIHQILIENYKSNITTKELSKLLNISESTIRIKYKEAYNKTTKNGLFEIKMIQAKALLEKNPNISFKELASNVGYTNDHRFKKDFFNFFNI